MGTSARCGIGLAVAVCLAASSPGTWATTDTANADHGSALPRAERFVRPDGVDSGDCSNPSNPCATLSYGVSQALSGDVVRLAMGSHPSGATLDGAPSPLTIQGGWSQDFTTQSDDPLLTVVTGSGLNHTTVDHLALTLERVTVTGATTGVKLVYWWPGRLAYTRDHRQLHKSLSLDRCVVRGNSVGVWLETNPLSGSFSLDLTNSMVVDNASVGVRAVAYSRDVVVTLTSSTITGNGPPGIEVWAYGDEPAEPGHAEMTVTASILWGNLSADLELWADLTGSVDLWASFTDLGVLTLAPPTRPTTRARAC